MIKPFLVVALLLSLGMNLYLFMALVQSRQSTAPLQVTAPERVKLHSAGHSPDLSHSDSPNVVSAPSANSQSPTLNDLKLLLEQGHYRELESKLQQALRTTPDNIDLLLLEGQLMVRTRPLSEAVLHLYSLRDLPLSAPQRQRLNQRINELVSTAINQLRVAENWDLLAQLLEPLFQLMPAHRPYILQLAEAYARQNKPTLMEDVLASLLSNDPQANRIRALLPATAPDDTDNVEASTARSSETMSGQGIIVQLEPDGAHFIANVRFTNEPARLMFDTGATTTAITRALYDRLRARSPLPFIGNFEVNTAAGRVSASMVQVPVVNFGPLRFTDLPVLVLPEDVMRDADGLLGMNMMQDMDFRLNQQTGELTLYQHLP